MVCIASRDGCESGPTETVIAVIDGGFQMTIQELEL